MSLKETISEVLHAILPITVVIILLQFTIVWFPMDIFWTFLVSVLLTIAGFTLFLSGVEASLLAIGELVGKSLMLSGKVGLLIGFGTAVGFSVTVAEPGVQVLAAQVSTVSGGAVSKYLLVAVVALGVGIFLSLALLRIIYKIPIIWLLGGGFILACILAFFSAPEFIAVAFDAGGATTGPVTVPFILALGVGMSAVRGSNAASAESFGFLGLGAVGPIVAILLLGVLYK